MHVRELTETLNKPLPVRENFVETKIVKKRSTCGRIYTVTIKRLISGKPFFRIILDDLHDSFWSYPVIRETVLAAPEGIVEAKTHAEYAAGLKARQANNVGLARKR